MNTTSNIGENIVTLEIWEIMQVLTLELSPVFIFIFIYKQIIILRSTRGTQTLTIQIEVILRCLVDILKNLIPTKK
jgi:hypothetical protein